MNVNDDVYKRGAFFAHYDPDGHIDAYVILYIHQLMQAGVEIIYFASDADVSEQELMKLPPGVIVAHSERHGEYDFGSWKRCLQACGIDHLSRFEELLLCNDSCYGPLNGFDELFGYMGTQNCDFWGVTQVEYFGRYFPSYFLGIRNVILKDPEFVQFFQAVGPFENKLEYCKKYEVGLFNLLVLRGYKDCCYLSRYSHLCHSSSFALTSEVFRNGMPFLRVMTVKTNPGGIADLGGKIYSICKETGYPFDIILSHVKRTSPQFKKFWLYEISDFEKTYFGLLRIRIKPDPNRDIARIKVWLVGIPIVYWKIAMKYSKEKMIWE